MTTKQTDRLDRRAWLIRVEPDEWLSRRDEIMRGKSIASRIASRLGSSISEGDYVVLSSMTDDDREVAIATTLSEPIRIKRKDNQMRVQPTYRVDLHICVSPDDIATESIFALTCSVAMKALDRSESDVIQLHRSGWTALWQTTLKSPLLCAQFLNDILFVPRERRACIGILCDSIVIASEQIPSGWALVQFPDAIELHVGPYRVFTMRSGWVEHTMRSDDGSVVTVGNWNKDTPVKRSEIQHAITTFMNDQGQNAVLPRSLEAWHSAGLVSMVQSECSKHLHNPAYWREVAIADPKLSVATAFNRISMAISVPESTFASFYTALQSKYFVILSGTSGIGKTKLAQNFADLLLGPPDESSNHLFLSVRPDWRDSKALLGFFNPLTEAYAWTPFLRFLERAARSYQAGDGLAWFVVLDEMNLAHVEYYFADLLSVMESGRDEDGWTREALALVFPEMAEGDVPEREMRLPPNLYVVGTVNIDETTHAFSPKVLDRAFSIELVDVDFRDYPPAAMSDAPELSDAERQTLLAAFTRNGRFPRIDKTEIAGYVAEHPEVRDRLQALNERLQRDSMHFGYRVFDEIVTFLAVAEENGMFAGLGADAAFDAAVLMKVLPKFHGSRGKLQRPLEALLAWCLTPDDPQSILPLPQPGAEADPLVSYRTLPYMLPKTAERVQRMLAELQTDGFTAFG